MNTINGNGRNSRTQKKCQYSHTLGERERQLAKTPNRSPRQATQSEHMNDGVMDVELAASWRTAHLQSACAREKHTESKPYY